MSEFLKNKVLSTYFLLDALVPDEIERRALFKKLEKIFCLRKQSFKLYDVCCDQAVSEIKYVTDYNRYLRIKEYNKLQGASKWSAAVDAITDKLISIKGNVLTEIDRLKIKTIRETNNIDAITALAHRANNGVILAMYAYGIILCEGLGVDQNVDEGIKYLKKVADWNNIEACIMCIYYCRSLKNEYGDKLYTYFIGTPYASDMDILSVKYGLSPQKDEVAALTCKLFSHHVAASDRYDWQISRILKCKALSEPDKQDIVLSGSRETIKKISALPLNLKSWDDYSVNPCPIPIGVEAEYKAVELALKNLDTLKSEKYRPLCICSDDSYLLNMYLKAISQTFIDCNVSTINVPELNKSDLYQQFSAEVLRGIKESSRNVVIISVYGREVADPTIAQTYSKVIHTILNTEKRFAFKVNTDVTLNLTELMPVVLCDRQNVDKFRSSCHVVRLSAMTDENKKQAIKDTVEANAKIYELKSAKIEEEALKMLVKMNSNLSIIIIDKLFATYDDGTDAVVSLDDVKGIIDDMGVLHTGF